MVVISGRVASFVTIGTRVVVRLLMCMISGFEGTFDMKAALAGAFVLTGTSNLVLEAEL